MTLGWSLWGILGVSQVLLVVKNLPANAGSTKDASSFRGLGRSSGEGNGNPLQYPCLENSMDRGAQWATVLGVPESQTGLSTRKVGGSSVGSVIPSSALGSHVADSPHRRSCRSEVPSSDPDPPPSPPCPTQLQDLFSGSAALGCLRGPEIRAQESTGNPVWPWSFLPETGRLSLPLSGMSWFPRGLWEL